MTPLAVSKTLTTDTGENFAFEAHQYLDENSSGTSNECVSGSGRKRLIDFTKWARENGTRGFLGEFGVGRNELCYKELDDLLSFIDSNRDAWIGWTYWAGGPWWSSGYEFNVEPGSLHPPTDRPQMSVLIEHLN